MSTPLPAAEPLSAFVERAKALYTLPAVAMKVLELTAAPQVDTRALKNCIENDPALTARLLRVVNSSLFGLSRQVSDLNQALALLGVKPLKLLVLGFSLPKALFEGLETSTLAAYWRRTLIKAAAARDICDTAWGRGGDEAFIAGLLQDIGQLALVQDLGEPYLAFLARVKSEGGDLARRELAALGFDHAMFSARLLDSWGLPRTLVTAIAQRQEVETLAALPPETRSLPQALHLAELAARFLADGQAAALFELHAAARRYADLSPETVERWLGLLNETAAHLADALDLELSEPIDGELLLAEAQTRLAADSPGAFQELEQVAEETRLWQEAESLRQTAAEFLANGNRVGARTAATSLSVVGAEQRSPRILESRSTAKSPSNAAVQSYEVGLLGRVGNAVNQCRQRRAPVSLLAAALDREEVLTRVLGAEGVRQAVQWVAATAASLCEAEGTRPHVEQNCVAIILEDCDRPQAVALGRRLVESAARLSPQERFGRPMTISVGAATLALPPRNFPPRELIEAAWRCLNGARASGGNVVKSIDIY